MIFAYFGGLILVGLISYGTGVLVGKQIPEAPVCQLCSFELKPVKVRPIGTNPLPTMPTDAVWYCAGNHHDHQHKFTYYGDLIRKPEPLEEL